MNKQTLLRQNLLRLFNRNVALEFPFAIYRLPNSEQIQIIAQNSSAIYCPTDIDEIADKKGFLVAPFVNGKQINPVLIRADYRDFSFLGKVKDSPPAQYAFRRKVNVMNVATFYQYIEHIKKEIENKQITKVVTARTIKYDKPQSFNEIDFFLKACQTYKMSFISLFYIPKKGLWIGASPELLLHYSNGVFSTYSLAGTQAKPADKYAKARWSEKEKEEQQIVSRFIENSIKAFGNVKLQKSETETIEAGNLLHLRNTYNIEGIHYSQWAKLVNALHPTPAVSGFPKEKAIEYILKNEGNNRAYYTGYLGTINIEEQINLFVNLRCMEVKNKDLILHVGCGITAESNAAKEWEETKLKSETLLNLIVRQK